VAAVPERKRSHWGVDHSEGKSRMARLTAMVIETSEPLAS
jgi:hypothetical protein